MKKIVFVVLAIILGIILSFLIRAIIEILYLTWAIKTGVVIEWISVFGGEDKCALPTWLIYLLPVLGIIFGIWLGLYLWQEDEKNKYYGM
ncbi:MAG: hypothetical protein COS25_00785 [Candidatus Nealsonbacteria bacterium CG02_land_8_20_14_3_00_37_10]|uniref:Uncharacterized protein n=1 Tax=Candidatus Nealsonbacteria bacterium CG02_land_8_20_14_3_00_37_10 TaxID=1974699 RepID=A0A2M7D9X2_9BACT|nr:MAG: hypothetical protein COS25_00785 [Candidatus Nealsonbacteria bacterium CG02_land_8_20_14_3_00_37_10]